MAFGIIFESAQSIASDYQKWRFRTGRANAVIPGQDQLSDIAGRQIIFRNLDSDETPGM